MGIELPCPVPCILMLFNEKPGIHSLADAGREIDTRLQALHQSSSFCFCFVFVLFCFCFCFCSFLFLFLSLFLFLFFVFAFLILLR